jgi:hypothetical protein
MRLDRIEVIETGEPGPLTERRIATVLAAVLAGLPEQPRTVVDGRPPSARAGATATYRLLVALGLPRAIPAAVSWTGSATDAYRALAAFVDCCPAPVLLVATNAGAPVTIGCCLAVAAETPVHAGAVATPEGGGFIDLLTALNTLDKESAR